VSPAGDLGALRTLAAAALGLVRRTRSGQLGLAQAATVIDPAMLPSPMRAEAAQELEAALRRSSEPLSARDVEKALKGAWRDGPKDVLDDFETEPAVVTPGAQVHRGVFDGSPVAVKVLRPGLPEIVRADLATAEALAGPLGAALPRSNARALLAEVRERVMDELDLEHEGQALRTFSRAVRGEDAVTVPRAIGELTHPGVLVCAWVDGTTVAERPPDDAVAFIRRFVAALGRAARNGVVHADPEPANVLLDGEGTLAFVDLGATRRIDPERYATALRALRAFTDGDDDTCAEAIESLGWLSREPALRAVALGRELAAPFLEGPVLLDAAALGDLADAALGRIAEVAELAGEVTVRPEDLWPLRSVATAVATIARLGVTADWPQLVLGALEDR
jgi:predicted unusual protein kinase regulating ubiquinone biosynthesis (AarF/ABC1/UbiB family)